MKKIRQWSTRHAKGMERAYGLFCKVAPVLKPLVKLFGKKPAEKTLTAIEQVAKSTFFDCQMCGKCALSYAGMACPMNCSKQLRNGPCGGVRADERCEADPTMRCVWLEALDGSKRMVKGRSIEVIQPPVDHRQKGSTTWLGVVMGEPTRLPEPLGEIPPHAGKEPQSLEQACRSGRFVVTAEMSPPDSVDSADMLRRADLLRGLVDAVNVTDSPGANCHMSSLAASALLAAGGHTPVFQANCRDRNRIAIQADLVGAAALGVHNLLCISGDAVGQGDHPQAKPVFDLDSVSLLRIARDLRDESRYASGRHLTAGPNLFIGATANPFAPPYRDRVLNLEKKIRAGAQYIQTQFCFDLGLLNSFMDEVRGRGLDQRCFILVGVGPLPSVRTARWLRENVPGVHIPEEIIVRLEQAKDQKREGIRICLETIQALREMKGVSGVHLMAHKNEKVMAEIIVESGLAKQPMAPCA